MYETSQEIHIEPLQIRGSTVVLIFKLIAIRIIFVLVRLLIRIPLPYLGLEKSTLEMLYMWDTYVIVALAVVEITIVIYIAIQWVHEYYEIRPKEIIHNKGFLFQKEEIYNCEHIQLFDLDQSMVGKLFDYGTITLYSPALEDRIHIINISRPARKLEEIRSVLGSITPKKPSGTVYLRRSLLPR